MHVEGCCQAQHWYHSSRSCHLILSPFPAAWPKRSQKLEQVSYYCLLAIVMNLLHKQPWPVPLLVAHLDRNSGTRGSDIGEEFMKISDVPRDIVGPRLAAMAFVTESQRRGAIAANNNLKMPLRSLL